ncbi:BCCT family transporter [Phytomonospora endophytica]|uniref:Choline/carnitine/betaine transport n=1 Tax=Phytomonospora endophytica TaxID=714109 RepID=A0A841FHL7_9ACTN|nr:BCCT family transporter [Phytomonospora endophytica]MBB6032587.1 choline/carnitine/betaine transport [Phytomonospora endophytica]GIG66263.1 BCCT family transporter [Phytomonospora endophytica]
MSETSHAEGVPAVPAEKSLPIDKVVFGLGAIIVLAVVAWGALGGDSLNTVAGSSLGWVLHNFGWLFVVAADVFLVLAVVIAASRFGRIRLGTDDEEPEFTTLAWVAMMFSAGMGIGLMFYGVAEPLTHYASPPPATGVAPLSDDSARTAMEYTFFHWLLHPWAIYAVAGLALAYATFRKRRGNHLSAAFVPLLGERRANGGPGRAIDLLAIFATVFGSATSLGLGALQIAAGLQLVAGVPDSRAVELIIIGALTAAFVVSAFSGVHRGVKWLSTANLILAAVLMVFVFVVGPTVYILDVLPASVGGYLNDLLPMATRTGAFSDADWLGTWTIFYWAWWLSWAPFVGTFIARISRGRTVRQFVVGVLLVPSGASAVWFSVLGGAAIRTQSTGHADLVGKLDEGGEEAALFGLLESLPWYTITSIVCVILVALYFVTGADSASLVLGSLSSRGSLSPRKWLVVTWGVLIGAVAGVLLVAGGLEALQQATILVALPFVLVMLALCWSLLKELREDPGAGQVPKHALRGLRAAVSAAVGEALDAGSVRRRLRGRTGPSSGP